MARQDKRQDSFMEDFRRFFGRGLAVLLPSILTLWLLWQAFVFLFNNVAEPINRGIRVIVVEVTPRVTPENQRPEFMQISQEQINEFLASPEGRRFQQRPLPVVREHLVRQELGEFWSQHWYLQAAGLLVAIMLIYLAGLLLGNYLGRRVYARIERLIAQVPGFKQVYPHVKQLVDLIMGDRKAAFRRVVMVQYPRRGIWTLGLVTSDSFKQATEATGTPCLAVFIPSTPTPFTGFTITVPRDEAIDVPMSIDEAIRFFITGGTLVPDRLAAQAHSGDAAAPGQAAGPSTPVHANGSGHEPGRSGGGA
ncbi:MAG: DUF502 domain-containing protein [Phycisphaerales bacterium]